MKKKSYLLLVASTMVLASCSWQDLMFWKKWFNKDEPGQKEQEEDHKEETPVITLNDVVKAFENTEKLDSVTVKTTANAGGTETMEYKSGKRFPVNFNTTINYVSEKVGKNTKVNTSYKTASEVSLGESAAILGVTKEEVASYLVECRNNYILYGQDYEVKFDFANDKAKLISPEMSQVNYVVYDEAAKQTFTYNEGQKTYYNLHGGGEGIVNTADIVEIIKKGTLNEDIVVSEVDGERIEIKVKLDGNYIASLEAQVDEIHMLIEYSKYNETSFEIPSACEKPKCYSQHNANSPYHYEESEEGHVKYCPYCYKILEQETPHVYTHNNNGYCEICGHVEGEEKAEYGPLPGFERGEDSYYARGEFINGVFVSDPYQGNNYDFECENTDPDTHENISYYGYNKEGVIVSFVRSEGETFTGTCINRTEVVVSLYKGLEESDLVELGNKSYYERFDAVKEFLKGQSETASVRGFRFTEIHDTKTQTTVIDECHSIKAYVCENCGKTTSSYIDTVHQEELVVDTKAIDACHTLKTSECPVCHDKQEEIIVNHVEAAPRVEEIALDSCHTLQKAYCSECGDLLGVNIDSHHGDNCENKTIQVDSCETKTLTICNDCHIVVSIHSEFNHGHATTITCDYETLRSYDFASKLGYYQNDSLYEFTYCSDCGKLVGGIVNEYPELEMNHPFNETSYYTIHDLNGSYDNQTSGYKHFDHELDENGFCKYCHSKVVELEGSSLGFIARRSEWNDYLNDYDFYFFNKETGEQLYWYNFDGDPEQGTNEFGNYNEYFNESYPGVGLRIYLDDSYRVVRVEVTGDNFATKTVILNSDFDH